MSLIYSGIRVSTDQLDLLGTGGAFLGGVSLTLETTLQSLWSDFIAIIVIKNMVAKQDQT